MDRQAERAALVASLSFNLFLVAAILAVVVWGGHHPRGRSAPPPLRAAAMSLEPAHRQAFLSTLRTAGRAVAPANRQARALRVAAYRSLELADFDPATAKVQLAKARELNQASSARVQDSVVDFAASLPVAERASLGKALAARMGPAPKPPRGPPAALGSAR